MAAIRLALQYLYALKKFVQHDFIANSHLDNAIQVLEQYLKENA